MIMNRQLLAVALLSAGTLAGCGSSGAVVYGGTPGSGGQGSSSESSVSRTGFVYTEEMPEECLELTEPCQACNEVESTRRRILEKKCVRVCDAYAEAGPAFADNVAPSIDAILRQPGMCGKTQTSCSAIEQSQCRYAMEYVSVGRAFLTDWATTTEVPPPTTLMSAYYDGVLVPVDALHQQVFEWGRVNETPVAPLMENYTKILTIRMDSMNREVLGEASSALPAEGEPGAERVRSMYKNVKSLSDTAMAPGGSVETYRTAWETANESFVTSRAAGD